MEDILGIIEKNGSLCAVILFICTVCFEISPIKFSPISIFLNWLGNKMNRDMWGKLDTLEGKFDSLAEETDSNRVEQIRWEILDFANSCRNKRLHTKDEFTHIMQQHSRYEELIQKRGFENGVIDAEYRYIVELYNRCCHENSFL
jgi:hypothetical protein